MKYLTKKIIIIVSFYYLCGTLEAVATAISDTNDGIFVAIAAWRSGGSRPLVSSEPILFTDHLICGPFSTIGAEKVDFPNRSFGFRIKMFGPDGKEISTTSLGKQIGVNFDDILTHPEGRSKGMYTLVAAGGYNAGDAMQGQILPAPRDWFEMEKPGIYTMELEIQVLCPPRNPGETRDHVVRFHPVFIKVEMPIDAEPTPKVPKATIISGLLVVALTTFIWWQWNLKAKGSATVLEPVLKLSV